MAHQKSETVKTILKVFFFIFFGVLFLSWISIPFKVQDSRIKPMTYGLREQPKNSIDCAIIGGSQTYSGWTPPFAYIKYGLTSWTYAIPRAPGAAVKYYVKEVHKTQPDALYVISTNTFKELTTPLEFMHHSADYMPLSLNKLEMVNDFRKTYGLSYAEAAELVFPFIRFHSNWNNLLTDDYVNENIDLKCGATYITFLNDAEDYSNIHNTSDTAGVLEPELVIMIDDLLAYLKEENVKVLFVTYPQALEDVNDAKRNVVINEYVEANGFDTLDLLNDTDEAKDLGFDYSQDLYDPLHANVHGSMKMTSYLAKYMIDKYGLDMKHSDAVDADWNESCNKYLDLVDGFLMDFEIHGYDRNNSLEKPSFLGKKTDKTGVHMSWGKVDGADGYSVFKKTKNSDTYDRENPNFNESHMTTQAFRLMAHEERWEFVADVKDSCEYVDTSITKKKIARKYRYNIVPYTEVNGVKTYGNYNYEIHYIKQSLSEDDLKILTDLQKVKDSQNG